MQEAKRARLAEFTLDDELHASGKFTLRSAGADSGVLVCFFDSNSKKNKDIPHHDQPETNLLGILSEGPSRIGHIFRPAYSTSTGAWRCPTFEGTPRQRPVLRPDDAVHDWELHYEPEAAQDRGKITLTFDGQPHYLVLEEGHRAQNATFDRFGIFVLQSGGHHAEIYLDDLSYSK